MFTCVSMVKKKHEEIQLRSKVDVNMPALKVSIAVVF